MVATKNDPNCAEPICADKLNIFKSSIGKEKKQNFVQPGKAVECPLDREELGNATWKLLHTIGIYYPDKPSSEYQNKVKTFVETLALMYPCVHCADDFQKEIALSPPRVESRTTFSIWLCEQHNIVNRKIQKPEFECTMNRLEERWRKGHPVCWGQESDAESAGESLGQ
ncbi:augmenter of liver regeneration [Plasmopara halstedii]|uniref:Sulfhydryl oxidase n=1 Tax=Plasmopara halstedii TaxID=4781 RepID=A0A0P1AF28_PLAHL|nr:augmenter of liver regeneration [Plasmopara halstedii]CEG39193.1 augmenter of liver regeneration [Plasmopara halstedii]|eukprot:XP_024575562.1 augmenter of liver regeneration [Plasmopara halstedii]